MQITTNLLQVPSLQKTSNYAITDTLKKLCQLICDIVLLPLNLLNQLFRGTPSQTPPPPLPAPTFLQKAEQQIKKIPVQIQAHKKEITALVTSGVMALSLYYYFVSPSAVKEAPSSINPNLMLQIGAGVTAILGVCLIYKMKQSCCSRFKEEINHTSFKPLGETPQLIKTHVTTLTEELEDLPIMTTEQIQSCWDTLDKEKSKYVESSYTNARETAQNLYNKIAAMAGNLGTPTSLRTEFLRHFRPSSRSFIKNIYDIFDAVALSSIPSALLIEAAAIIHLEGASATLDKFYANSGTTNVTAGLARLQGSAALKKPELSTLDSMNAIHHALERRLRMPSTLYDKFYNEATEELQAFLSDNILTLLWYKDQLTHFITTLATFEPEAKLVDLVKDLGGKISEGELTDNQPSCLDLLRSLNILLKYEAFLNQK